MKKIIILLIIIYAIFISVNSAIAEPIKLESGDYSMFVERISPLAVNQPVEYRVGLQNRYDGSPLKSDDIKLESFLSGTQDSSIIRLSEQQAGVYTGKITYSKKGNWSVTVLGTVKESLGVYPYRAAFQENLSGQLDNTAYQNNAPSPPQESVQNTGNGPSDEEIYYNPDKESGLDFGVVSMFLIVIAVALLAAFYPKYRKRND
jgi:hypothetical protein